MSAFVFVAVVAEDEEDAYRILWRQVHNRFRRMLWGDSTPTLMRLSASLRRELAGQQIPLATMAEGDALPHRQPPGSARWFEPGRQQQQT